MIERLTLVQLEAMLKGRAVPGNKLVNETTAQYLHREIQRLATERDDLRKDRDGLLEAGAHLL